MFAVYPLCCRRHLGFALRDNSRPLRPEGRAARTRGGTAHEGWHARGWGHPNPSHHSERPRETMSAPASLPIEILRSAERGELQKVVKWLRKGGSVGAI